MRTWMKYLVIGWSIISVGIIIISFQFMKKDFIEEAYEIYTVYKTPEKENSSSNWETIGENLFYEKDDHDLFNKFISKEEFVERMKKAKGINIYTKNRIKDRSIYVQLPLYAFAVWAIPILVFSLVGSLFTKKHD